MDNHIIFAKKLIIPFYAANTLQSLNMVYSFAANGVKTTFFPGL
jgi:hypothetical protein